MDSFRVIALIAAGMSAGASLGAVLLIRDPARVATEADVSDCEHVAEIADVVRADDACGACQRIGARWIHLRQCLTCGHVGCCDASRYQHATAHFRSTGHPIVRSLALGEDWRWCYLDDRVV